MTNLYVILTFAQTVKQWYGYGKQWSGWSYLFALL